MIESKCYFDVGFAKNISLSLPLAIQIEITELCNFSCPFCYNNSGSANNESFDVNKWKRFLSELKCLGGVFQCAFSGGEPLLYKDELLELFDILHSDNTGLLLITNAFLLDEAFIQKLRKYNWYWVQISLDSHKSDIHDYLRGANGSFERSIQAIRLLKKAGLPVAISAVICSENLDDINEIVQLGYDLHVDIVLLSPVLPIGRTINQSQLQLNNNQLCDYYKNVEIATEKFSSRILVRSAQPYNEQIENSKLYPPYGLLIRPNGDVKIDCLSKTIVGNVFETPINEIWINMLENERWKIL